MDLLDSFKKSDSPTDQHDIPATHENNNCLDWTSKKRNYKEMSNAENENALTDENGKASTESKKTPKRSELSNKILE